METIKQKVARPSEVLDGNNMQEDIFRLIGYVHSMGVTCGPKGVFDSEHFKELGEQFLRSYRKGEARSPKADLNLSHMISRLVSNHEYLDKAYDTTKEKLNIHEFYMNQMQRNDRTTCDGLKDGVLWDLKYAAERMKKEAEESMTKPESFDDIPDEWTNSVGQSVAQTEYPKDYDARS